MRENQEKGNINGYNSYWHDKLYWCDLYCKRLHYRFSWGIVNYMQTLKTRFLMVINISIYSIWPQRPDQKWNLAVCLLAKVKYTCRISGDFNILSRYKFFTISPKSYSNFSVYSYYFVVYFNDVDILVGSYFSCIDLLFKMISAILHY